MSKRKDAELRKKITLECKLEAVRLVKQECVWFTMRTELLTRCILLGKERVRQLTQRHCIKAKGKKKFVATTHSKHDLRIARNQVWSSVITYTATDEGWLNQTAAIELFRCRPELSLNSTLTGVATSSRTR